MQMCLVHIPLGLTPAQCLLATSLSLLALMLLCLPTDASFKTNSRLASPIPLLDASYARPRKVCVLEMPNPAPGTIALKP